MEVNMAEFNPNSDLDDRELDKVSGELTDKDVLADADLRGKPSLVHHEPGMGPGVVACW
jgi:hypothetical protein